MSKPVLIVDNVSKSYRIGHKAERFPTFRDALVGALPHRFGVWGLWLEGPRLRMEMSCFGHSKKFHSKFKRVMSLASSAATVRGKSTLLKVLRITEPTSGYAVVVAGRVASLLEVGTGFHPELTGRENIYLNGATLGMGKRQEIHRKFDEIVAFAEVEKFLDTPVKFYSSGMYASARVRGGGAPGTGDIDSG